MDGENRSGVWLLVLRKSEITRKAHRVKLSPMSCKPGTCSRAFKGGGGVALGGKRKGRVECIGMLGRAGPAWNGQCLVLKLNYIHCPVRKQETSLLTQRLLFRTTLIVMSRPRDVCTDQFQMVTVMNDKKESASPLFTSPHISTSYA